MIKKSEKQVEMQFGTGDIGFNPGALIGNEQRIGTIIFYNQEPREIGSTGDIAAETEVDIRDFPVIMTFYKKESIDVLIEALLEAKKEMD